MPLYSVELTRNGLKREILTLLREEFTMRRSNTKMVLTACEMSFNGKTDAEIATLLETSGSNVSRWRKSEVWKEFEQELISAHKQSLLEAYRSTTLDDSTPEGVRNIQKVCFVKFASHPHLLAA